jgi:hypothetical protein
MPSTKTFVAALLVTFSLGRASAQSRVIAKVDQREVQYSNSGHFDPVWSNNGLYGVDFNPSDEPILWRIRKDGWREDIRFSFSGGRQITLLGASGAPNGGMVVIGGALSDDGRGATFLSCIGPDHSTKTITRLSPFVPKAVTVAPDGTIWVVGWVRGANDVQEYNVLKRFDASGLLISTASLKARGPSWNLAGDATAWSILRASKDRVGWLTAGNEYLEFSLDGREVSRVNGPPGQIYHYEFWSSFVLSDANEVLVGFPTDSPRSGALKLWSLDRAKSSWSQVGGESLPGKAHLFGFDGDTVLASGTTTPPGVGPPQTIDRFSVSALNRASK